MNVENINVGDYLISIKKDDVFYVGEKCIIKEIYRNVPPSNLYNCK